RSAPTPSARAWPPYWATCRAATTSATAAWRRSPRSSSASRCLWAASPPCKSSSAPRLRRPTRRSPSGCGRGPRTNRGRRGRRRAATASAALFVIHIRRGAAGLKALLGETILGLICSDRWSAYHLIPLERRQLCWAQLRRDFQAMIDRGGAAAQIGEELLFNAEMLFDLWYKVCDGTRSRRWLEGQIEGWLRAEVRSMLEQGAGCGCAKT